jgi:hypothetical protein
VIILKVWCIDYLLVRPGKMVCTTTLAPGSRLRQDDLDPEKDVGVALVFVACWSERLVRWNWLLCRTNDKTRLFGAAQWSIRETENLLVFNVDFMLMALMYRLKRDRKLIYWSRVILNASNPKFSDCSHCFVVSQAVSQAALVLNGQDFGAPLRMR